MLLPAAPRARPRPSRRVAAIVRRKSPVRRRPVRFSTLGRRLQAAQSPSPPDLFPPIGHAFVPFCGLSPVGRATMVESMRGFIALCRSRNGKIGLNVASAVLGIGVAVLAAQHFAETGWPLANADFELVVAAGGFFLL